MASAALTVKITCVCSPFRRVIRSKPLNCLTGIGKDGADGFAKIKEKGGATIAQSTNTCVYPNLTQNSQQRRVEQKSKQINFEKPEIIKCYKKIRTEFFF